MGPAKDKSAIYIMKHEMTFRNSLKKYEKKRAKRKDTFNTPFASVSRHLIKLTCACHSCLTHVDDGNDWTPHGGGGGEVPLC
jgi:hypothetical protein